MNSLIKYLDKTLSAICITMIGLLAVGVIISVFLRYFLSLSYGWVEEFLTMLFVFDTFLGAAVCVREKQHISINYFTSKLHGTLRIISEIFIQIVIIVVSGFLMYYSIRWIQMVGSTVSPNSGVPFGFFYSIIPISSSLTVLYSIVNILSHFIHIEEPQCGYFDDSYLGEGM
ncbi:TRAP transporter small permease [uncultured Sphaerochaeta sp.]|uniref:TRAP transporter small permease n=1 Tax=uncultured Sphaerochaeta sp. TaxID=886478 RepID=UPI002A0A4193|nr:TRAP transporter small permease [uncultured Sphaerochaeta sp.]